MAGEYPEIFVLRHGETEWNAEGRYQGSLNSPLTERGQIQAAQQGEILRARDVSGRGFQVFSSPQGRVRHTAEIVTEIIGCAHVPDPRLVELRQGAWEGLLESEIKSRWPHVFVDRPSGISWYFENETGETYAQICARAQSFLDALTGPSVIITHGVTSHILRGLWLGLDLAGCSQLEGGQGCVYHLKDGQHTKLER